VVLAGAGICPEVGPEQHELADTPFDGCGLPADRGSKENLDVVEVELTVVGEAFLALEAGVDRHLGAATSADGRDEVHSDSPSADAYHLQGGGADDELHVRIVSEVPGSVLCPGTQNGTGGDLGPAAPGDLVRRIRWAASHFCKVRYGRWRGQGAYLVTMLV
jgi:hypothetical protein